MRSSLTITTPASELTLLTVAERRAAAGATDGSRDAELLALDLSISASIMSECNIAIGVGAEPTLRKETLTETFFWPMGCDIVLSRRHNVVISSITNSLVPGVADDVVMDVGDYMVDPESGILTRLWIGYPAEWYWQTVVVVYDAGFETIPADLKRAVTDFFRASLNEAERDPFVKSESIEVVGVDTVRRDYWVGSVPGTVSEGAVPDIVAGQLKRFRNPEAV